jgi:hypothetical protein
MWRGFVIPVVGVALTGCASVTKDVDAYYRQMATNYGEAIEKAKVDEVSEQSKAKVLAATGDARAARKAQREAERIKAWQEHCAWEKERFEKAAKWMETHFDAVGKAVASENEAAKAEEPAAPIAPDDAISHAANDSAVRP